MTLIIGLKYKDGALLASDKRMMIGDLKRDTENKVRLITPYVGVAMAGYDGIDDDIMREVKDTLGSRREPADFSEIYQLISDTMLKWYDLNHRKLDEDMGLNYIVTGSERIRRILFPRGFSEESRTYTTMGSGGDYGEYILSKSYKGDLTEEEAKKLAIYAIVETSKMTSTVGEEPSLFLFRLNEKAIEVTEKEIRSIKRSLISKSIFAEGNDQLAIEIVQMRETVNNLFKAKFRFHVFSLSERASLDLARPCLDEESFVTKISSLGLLADSLRGPDLKKGLNSKTDTESKYSISLLEEFLQEKFPNRGEEIKPIIDNLKVIRSLRSRHYPTHNTQPDFIELVYKLTGSYPPSWSDLWIIALEKYKEVLTRLKMLLEKTTRTSD